MDLVAINQQPTMSSREIAELVESRHDKVKQSIERLAARGVIGLPPLGEYLDSLGRPAQEYRIGKRDSYVVVAQLSPEFTARLVDRWQELEAQASDPMRVLNDPAAMRGLLLGYTEKVIELEGQVKQLAPKAAALSRLTEGSDGSFCLTDAAKDLQAKPREFFKKLQEMGWIYRRPGTSGWIAYQHRITQGVLEHKVTVGEKADGTEWLSTQVRVTARGMAKLSEIFVREAA